MKLGGLGKDFYSPPAQNTCVQLKLPIYLCAT